MLDTTFNKYKNLFSYQPYGTQKYTAYQKEQYRLESLFYSDCAKQYNYTNNAKRAILESIAWEHGHSSGFSEIHNWILILLPLIE